jgi:ASC-1-like (ASCH) protein
MAIGLAETRRIEEERKRRVFVIEGLLRNYQAWQAIYEDSGVETLLIMGEEWNFHDMLKGIDQLPPRQRQAVWMILIEDQRPVDVAREMFAGNKRIVGEMAVQYKDDALAKLATWHEQQKEGGR